MSNKRLLSEMFGLVPLPVLREDEDDDAFEKAGWGGKSDPHAHTNNQLSGATSVAGTGRSAPAKGGAHDDVQNSLNGARSIFKKEAATPTGGLQINGDKETLDALMQCLQEAEHTAGEPDLATWAGKAWKAVAAGIRGSGTVTLPKFEQAPEDLMPDEEPEEEF